jgi:hypothetical protein
MNRNLVGSIYGRFSIKSAHLSNCNRELSIDASYQVSFHLPNGFRGEESKKTANQKQESPVVAMFVNGSGRNEQSL